jgi:hypothetical protein
MLVSWETRNIFPEVSAFTNTAGEPQPWPASFIVLAQAKDYFRKVLSDGIAILKEFFDLSSEENLLRHLPTTYEWMDKGISNTGVPGSFYEEDDGIVMCLAAIVLGDIEFVERYATDSFQTMYPKREEELRAILAALPDLKPGHGH